ncbi:MAG: ABC transporter permease subunit [Planctomycetales bacterium]|nr:ABC transporter permease subunit [Planctomycetales bacterium]
MRFLLRKALGEAIWPWLACAAALLAYAWLRVWLVAQLEMSNFQKIVLSLGDEFAKFSPIPLDQLFTYLGRVARTYGEPIVTMCVTAWAVSRGSDVVSGELGRGTMEMVLSQPVSRRQILVSHAAVVTAGSALLCAIVWLGIYLGVQTNQTTESVQPPLITLPGYTIPNPWGEPVERVTPMREQLPMGPLLAGSANLFCLAFFMAGFAAWMSSWDRYRWRTIGIVIAFLIAQSTLLYFSLALESLGWLGWLTVFTAYNPERFISAANQRPGAWLEWSYFDTAGDWAGPGMLAANLTLLSLGALAYGLAGLTFRRRDLPPPL